VGRGLALRTHLGENHSDACLGGLPRGLRPRESAADDVDDVFRHVALLTAILTAYEREILRARRKEWIPKLAIKPMKTP
jgi:hypothetical protein